MSICRTSVSAIPQNSIISPIVYHKLDTMYLVKIPIAMIIKTSKLRKLYVEAEMATSRKEAIKVLKKIKKAERKALMNSVKQSFDTNYS